MALSPTLVELCVVLLDVSLVESGRAHVRIILSFMLNQVIVVGVHRVSFQLLPLFISRREHLLRDLPGYLDNALFLIALAPTLQQLLGQLNGQVFSFALVGGTQVSHEFEVCVLEVGILVISGNKTRLVSDITFILSIDLPGVDLGGAFKYGLVFACRPTQTPRHNVPQLGLLIAHG